MHLRATHLDLNAANLYPAIAASRAAANKRAADVRKKLMSSTAEVEDELDTGRVQAVNHQFSKNSRQPPERKQPTAKDKQQSKDEPSGTPPVSVWG